MTYGIKLITENSKYFHTLHSLQSNSLKFGTFILGISDNSAFSELLLITLFFANTTIARKQILK